MVETYSLLMGDQAKAKQVKKNKKGKAKGGPLKKPVSKTESETKETEKTNSGKNPSSNTVFKRPAADETKKDKRGWEVSRLRSPRMRKWKKLRKSFQRSRPVR